MSALSISKAIQLYRLLGDMLPEPTPDMSVLTFIQQIVYNIRITGRYRIYVEALALMQGTDVDTILTLYTPEESVAEFSNGLRENQILALREYCQRVGF